MSTEKNLVYLNLNPKSGMFFDQHSGVKLLPNQQMAFEKEKLAGYPRLQAALRSGHIFETQNRDESLTLVGIDGESPEMDENFQQKPEEAEEANKQSATKSQGSDDDDDDDDDDDEDDEDDDDEDDEDTSTKKKVPPTKSATRKSTKK